MNILVVGSGAREHAIVRECLQSNLTDRVYCAPGNAGIGLIAQCVDITEDDFDALAEFCKAKYIDLTIVGPETSLVNGIVDRFEAEGLAILGPNKDAALLEGSKMYAKSLMRVYGIPTADFSVFAGLEYARYCIKERGAPCVVKADGLAGGKGVVVAKTVDEAIDAVDRIAELGLGETVVIEEILEGWECSFIILTDGENFVPLTPACDYKRLLDGDEGPNTGGMGAYAPVRKLHKVSCEEILNTIVEPTLDALKKEGIVYKGFLYFGLMMTKDGPKLLEYNCRLGDPEAQVILPLIENDFVELCLAAVDGRLSDFREPMPWEYNIRTDSLVAVTIASPGYPDSPDTGHRIYGLEQAAREGALVFHGSSELDKNGEFVTSGGRALSIVGRGASHRLAREQAYRAAGFVSFAKGRHQYRKDIATGV